MQSNVRELEGALRRVIATAEFTGRSVTIELAKEALRDLLALQDRLVTIDNIQRTVAQYFKVRVVDLTSRRRNRSITKPRHHAMALAKVLTNHSLPEIGDAFGGRDHTTVLYACRKITELREHDVTTSMTTMRCCGYDDLMRRHCTNLWKQSESLRAPVDSSPYSTGDAPHRTGYIRPFLGRHIHLITKV